MISFKSVSSVVGHGMIEDFERQILDKLKAIEQRIEVLEAGQERLKDAYGRSRAHLRRSWIRPPMWTYEQFPPRPLNLFSIPRAPPLPSNAPRIAIVTPSLNQARYLGATVDSVLDQNYPRLYYLVQDCKSNDGTVEILNGYGDRINWRSESDNGQSDAINLGFAGVDCDIMGYLNSDDTLLPGALAHVVDFFQAHPDIDIVYGHRVFIDYSGSEIGRAVLPAHNDKALLYAGYIPQETMFWRRRVWVAIGGMDVNFQYALDWDFMLRAQAAGFKFARMRRFLACFRVHDEQKTTRNYEVGRKEMQTLRKKYLGHVPSNAEIVGAIGPYLVRQWLFHWSYRIGLLKQ